MSNETLFYVFGVALAVSAVLVSFLGLRVKSFPGKAAPLVALWFVLLVGCATTFAVLHAQDEEQAKAAELTKASEEAEGEEEEEPVEGNVPSAEEGAGETLKLSAVPDEIAFDTKTLTAKNGGEVTIDFDNPSALEHDVAIERDGEQIAISETIAEGETSVSAKLEPGTYTFLCTVPGHAEAGMEGTLTVK